MPANITPLPLKQAQLVQAAARLARAAATEAASAAGGGRRVLVAGGLGQAQPGGRTMGGAAAYTPAARPVQECICGAGLQ